MKYLLLIVQMWYAASVQVESPNCLRNNPKILDAEFSLWNRFERHDDFSAEDVAKHVTLFSTRFKHGHICFEDTDNDELRLISEGLSIYTKTTNRSFQLFISSATKGKTNVSSAIKFYKTEYKIIKQINSRSTGILAGLYLDHDTDTYDEDLEVVNSVFGSKNKSNFPVGEAYQDCFAAFKEPALLPYLQRLDFVACALIPIKMASPESSAYDVILRCKRLQDVASFYNITSEIRCSVGYPSYGMTTSGIVGSVSGFQKFWCKIIHEIKLKNYMPQIIMDSAFDDTPVDYKNNTVDLHDAIYHGGWWRRRETTSYEASAFLEKVEELEGGTEPGNCTPLCSPCNSSGECCQGTLCQTDSSFQPFENTTQQTCQNALTECAPRIPKPPEWTSPDGQSFPLLSVFIIIIVALIFIVVAAAWLLYRMNRTKSVLTKIELSNFFDGSLSSPDGDSAGQLECEDNADRLPYDQTLEVANKTFEIYDNKFLGSGAFGVVVKGLLNTEDVAVKTTLPGADKTYVKSLLMELKILMLLGKHENIVNLRGAHTKHLSAGKVYLFLELCPFGSLLEFLRRHRETFSSDSHGIKQEMDKNRLSRKDLLQWSVQIAGAMEHLAVQKVVHSDIAARNVLVFSKDQVKLTDFGLSRRLYQYKNYVRKSQEPLPWRHMSVEALADMNFSVKSDVWSFGVTLWEMFSLGKVPYPGHSLSQDFVELLQDGLHPPCPQHAHPLIYEVMKICWTKDFRSRPQISIVKYKLVNALDELFTTEIYYRPIDKTEEWES